MTDNFNIVDKILKISVNPFDGPLQLDYFEGQEEVIYKFSWEISE